MIEDTVSKIEAKIQASDSIKDERKRELLHLLGTLKSEIDELSKTHGEQAQSIAGFAEVSTHEATRAEQNPELTDFFLLQTRRTALLMLSRLPGPFDPGPGARRPGPPCF